MYLCFVLGSSLSFIFLYLCAPLWAAKVSRMRPRTCHIIAAAILLSGDQQQHLSALGLQVHHTRPAGTIIRGSKRKQQRQHHLFRTISCNVVSPDLNLDVQSDSGNAGNNGNRQHAHRSTARAGRRRTKHSGRKRRPKVRAGAFNKMLDQLAKEESYEAAEQAESKLFERLREAMCESLHGSIDLASFNICLNAWSKCGNAPRAAALLSRMEHMKDMGIIHVEPNQISYSTVAEAWRQSDQEDSLEEMAKVLDLMQENLERDDSRKEDLVSLNMELDLLARDESANSAETAELMLFEELRKAATLSDGYIGCDVISFNAVLKAWSKLGNAPRASQLLSRFEYLSDTMKVLPFGPNSVSYATCIAAWANSPMSRAPFEAESLLDRVESECANSATPTIHMYASTIQCWSHSKRSDAAHRAQLILDRLERLYSAGEVEKTILIKPNLIIFTSIINCWGRSQDENALQQAESLFQRMKNSEDPDMLPNEFTYAAMINACSGRGIEAAEKADMLVKEVESSDIGLVPNVYIYTNLIKVWAKSSDPHCGSRAEEILSQMIASDDANVRPNLFSFTATIEAWIRQGGKEGPFEAERLLRQMIEYSKKGWSDVRPDRLVYSKVINALEGLGDDPNAKEKAESLKNESTRQTQQQQRDKRRGGGSGRIPKLG